MTIHIYIYVVETCMNNPNIKGKKYFKNKYVIYSWNGIHYFFPGGGGGYPQVLDGAPVWHFVSRRGAGCCL